VAILTWNWLECPACEHCGSARTRFARTPNSTGFQVRALCEACGNHPRKGRAWWSKAEFPPDQLAAMAELPESPQLELVPLEQRCPICLTEVRSLELHHLAPRERFGAEAERWPTTRVCRACHERWHARMDHPINHQLGSATENPEHVAQVLRRSLDAALERGVRAELMSLLTAAALDGHCYLDLAEVRRTLSVRVPLAHVIAGIEAAAVDGLIVVRAGGRVYLTGLDAAEQQCADGLRRLAERGGV
jgi:hypothetical protein